MNTAVCIFIKILQLITTIAAFIVKKLSDSHAERVLLKNQKFSSEWSLLNNVTWNQEGNDFSTFTLLGYMYISIILLISRFFIKNMTYALSENIFLFFGAVFFTIQGVLIIFSVEYLPFEIKIYSFLLGGLSFLAALLYLLDFLVFGKVIKNINKLTQTDNYTDESKVFYQKSTQVDILDNAKVHNCDKEQLESNFMVQQTHILRTDF